MRAPRTTVAVLLLAAGLTACGDDGDGEAAPPTTGAPTTTSTTAPTTTSSTAAPDEDERCENPEGFSVVPPEGWVVNDGTVTGPCSQFSPEPFEVPEATDERVAAITAYVDPVPYAEVATTERAGGVDRAVTAIDGRQAVRLSYQVDQDGLFPPGTPITLYAVDLTPDGGGPATLLLDAVGTAPFDHEAAVAALDRMVRTLDVTAADVPDDHSIVATTIGGGGGFSVSAEHTGDETCLRIPPGREPACTADPGDDLVRTVALSDLAQQVLAGVTGPEVWRVDVRQGDGSVRSALPAPVPGSDLGAFALAVDQDSVAELVLRDVDGTELASVGSEAGP